MKQRATFLLAGAVAITATITPARGNITPKAAVVARALEGRYHEAKTLQAIFLERYSDSRQGLQAESGTVYFSRPGRMRWEYEAPERKLFVSDGKTVWFYVPSDRTVTRAPIKESTDWRTPLALLTGKAKLSQLCESVDISADRPGARGNVVLSCRPRGEKSKSNGVQAENGIESPIAPLDEQFDQVLLEVNPETGELSDVRILQPGGIELEYRFGNWQENLPLADSLFRFQAPAGVAIVDEPRQAHSSDP
jgi:outer membrane lipoprotein carrier protein